jgi:hypothetical protein
VKATRASFFAKAGSRIMKKTLLEHLNSVMADLHKANPMTETEKVVVTFSEEDTPWERIVQRAFSDLSPADILNDPPGTKQRSDSSTEPS